MWGADDETWLENYVSAIQARSLGSTTTVMEMNDFLYKQNGTIAHSVNYINSPSPMTISQTTNAEVILTINWSTLARNDIYTTSSSDIAAAVVDYLLSQHPEFLQLPIHLIGHSRGGSVVSEISRILGYYGIWVDQQTTLDPHPVNADGNNDIVFFEPWFHDASVKAYENTVFADNYWQHTDPYQNGGTYPAGESIIGAFNGNLDTRFLADSLNTSLSADHGHVYDLYYATINLTATNLLSSPTEAIPRSIWFTTNENGGENCGYKYSRIVGGVRPVSGMSSVFDGNGNSSRSSITRNTATGSQWPNVFNLQIVDSRFTLQAVPAFQIGETLNLRFQYQSYDSQAFASLYLDTDQNPYNGNSTDILGTLISCPATGGSQVLTKNPQWNTTGRSPGYYYLYVKIEDGFGHIRYIYAPKKIQIVSQGAFLFVDASRPDDSGSGANWANAKKTIQAALDSAGTDSIIYVANGIYGAISSENKAVTIQSVNGAGVTFIDGGGATGCATLGSDASHTNTLLHGFTLRNGKNHFGKGAGSYYGTLYDCILFNNIASAGKGGGSYGSILYNCKLLDNTAGLGGGSYGGVLNNCLLTGNFGSGGGGAFNSVLNNCTICANTCGTADGGGAGVNSGILNNCIVYANTDYWSGETKNYVNSSFRYSCTTPAVAGTGNISADPQFVNAPAGDLRLQATSPCIDIGSNEYAVGSTDLAGGPRISNGTVDMGAYEVFQLTVTFDTRGGTACPSQAYIVGSTYGTLPISTRTGYVFDGWYTQPDGAGVNITSSSLVSSSVTTLYAKWCLLLLVSFDTQGGTACPSQTYIVSFTYGTLPTSTRTGLALEGWYTQPNGAGVKITSSSLVSSSVTTLYAKWHTALPLFNPDGGAHFAGSLSVTVSCATEGATIRYTIDGSEPTETSIIVPADGVVSVPVPGILKAKAWESGWGDSQTKSAHYLMLPHIIGCGLFMPSSPLFMPRSPSFMPSPPLLCMTVSLTFEGTAGVTHGIEWSPSLSAPECQWTIVDITSVEILGVSESGIMTQTLQGDIPYDPKQGFFRVKIID
jgi:uncharacterized repeat protein (TIGR02543 family)